MSIGRRTGIIGAAAAEHLTFGQQLGVDFQPDNRLKIHPQPHQVTRSV
jgi:hypothetical protein